MANLVYLVAVVVASTIGVTIIRLRHRQPSSLNHGIKEFRKGLHALSPQSKGRITSDENSAEVEDRINDGS